jgi:hypothetical protein
MEIVLIAAAGLCLLFLLAACYRWCALVNRVRASRQDGIVCKFRKQQITATALPNCRSWWRRNIKAKIK